MEKATRMDKMISKNKGKKAICALMVFMIIIIAAIRAPIYATSDSIRFNVEQVFTTNSANADDSFTYILRPLNANSPLPSGAAAGSLYFTIKNNGAYTIGPMAYSKAGIYNYELYQSIGNERTGYTYDRQIYLIEVQVNTDLKVMIVVYNGGKNKTDRIVFENSYNLAPTDPKLMMDPPVRKTVAGNPARVGEFIFTLKAYSSAYPMPTGSSGGAKTVKINGEGRAEFGTWSYNKVGTYYYTVVEENTGARGYTYDTTVYTITDVVSEDGGRLVLNRVVTNDMNKPVTSLDFHNEYSPIGGILGGDRTERENPGNAKGADSRDDDPWTALPVNDDPFADFWDGENPFGSAPGRGAAIDGPDGSGNPGNAKLGVAGPKTGDDTNAMLYISLLLAGGALAAGASIFIIVSAKRKKQQS